MCVRGSIAYNVTVHVRVLWLVFTHVLIRCRHTVERKEREIDRETTPPLQAKPPIPTETKVTFFYIPFKNNDFF